MKRAEAEALIAAHATEQARRAAGGYRVHCEVRERGFLTGEYFPDREEAPFATEEEAWIWAARFAAVAPSRYVNVFVVRASDWVPVDGYAARVLNDYPAREAKRP